MLRMLKVILTTSKLIKSMLLDMNFNLFTYSGQPHLTSAALANWVNSELGLEANQKYSAKCMQRWLYQCGFKV